MEKLDEMERDFEQEGLKFEVRGLDALQPLADNVHAARKRGLATARRIIVIADESLEEWLEREFIQCGATGYTAIPCYGAGRRNLGNGRLDPNSKVRIEVVATTDVCDQIVDFLRREILPKHHVTACIEKVEVVRVGHFTPPDSEQAAEQSADAVGHATAAS